MSDIFHVQFPYLGIENIPIQRVAFTLHIGGLEVPIYWYGILIASALAIGLLLALHAAESFNLSHDDVLDAFIAIVPLSIIGARLYYVAFSWSMFRNNLALILNTRIGGMAFYGSVIGAMLALLLVSWRKHLYVTHYFDFFVPYLALGQAIGRWGNFFNQEAFGVATELPWGMKSEGTVAYLQNIGYPLAQSPVHPTFLYECLGNLLIFVILLRIRRSSTLRGETVLWYLGLYGILRYLVEGLRTDPLMIGRYRVSQLLSLLMLALAVLLLLLGYLRQRRIPAEERRSAFLRPADEHFLDAYAAEAEAESASELPEENTAVLPADPSEKRAGSLAETQAEAVPEVTASADAALGEAGPADRVAPSDEKTVPEEEA